MTIAKRTARGAAALALGYALLGISVTTEAAAENVVPPPPVPATNPAKAATKGAAGWDAEVATSANELEVIANKVSTYFNNLKDMSGRFIQTASDNTRMKGKFKVKRPGRFRFDYARPSLQVIISDGTYLAIQDLDLKNEDRIALDQTPFRLLLRKDVNLVRDAKITAAEETAAEVRITIEDKSKDTPGRITVVLGKKGDQLEIREWTTTDAQGLDTRVEVGNLDTSKEISAKEFVIKSVDLGNFHPN